jgi:glycosyltransferase involved in cell wall biosynthesis
MAAESSPAVSVVMATKNAERYLVESLDSVAAQTQRSRDHYRRRGFN